MTDASLLRYVRSWHPTDVGTDNDLLSRFAEGHDEKAFATLVHRHAGLVWGVCRRTLGHSSDAEDAFQATFLVLARNPGKVRKTGSVAAFLFGIARRVALKARVKRSRTVPDVVRPMVRDAASEAAVRELQTILDEEVTRLPARYRDPFVLCILDGRPRAVAATELRLPEGTLSSRLARARILLRTRLAKRGVQLSSVLAVNDLARGGDVPGTVVSNALKWESSRPSITMLAAVTSRGPVVFAFLFRCRHGRCEQSLSRPSETRANGAVRPARYFPHAGIAGRCLRQLVTPRGRGAVGVGPVPTQ